MTLEMPPLPHPADDPSPDADRAAFRMPDPRPSARMPQVIAKRADFLACAKAMRAPMPGFLLQARDRADGGPLRVGFTCSKKLGNAVARNRAKRRLREIARMVLPQAGRAGWDYVLVGRPEASATRDFAQMRDDLARAVAKVHR